MKKVFVSFLAISGLLATAALATEKPKNDFGAAFGAGFSGSGTFGATFARGTETGGGKAYGQTEITADAGSSFATSPLKASGFANTRSTSGAGSLVNGNGFASSSTGGIAVGGTVFGGTTGFKK